MGWLKDLAKKNSSSGSGGMFPVLDDLLPKGGGYNFSDPNAPLQKMWNRNKLPQFYGTRYSMGGYDNYNLMDPRLLLYGPMLGLGVSAIQQTEAQRRDKELEKQYMPIAERNAGIAAQNANYGGTQGGSGTASAQSAFEEVLNQLIQAKRASRQQQMAQEMQAVTALMSVLGYAAGGPAGAGIGSALGTTATPYMVEGSGNV